MPRKPKLKCPKELSARLDEINRIPAPNAAEWPEFLAAMKALNELLQSADARVRWAGYEPAVEHYLPAKFRSFALTPPVPSLIMHAKWKEAEKWIHSLRVERTELRQFIKGSRSYDEGDIIRVQSERHFALNVKGIPYELDRGGPLSFIIRNAVPVDSLNICPVCDEVYWEKKRGSLTCGKRHCSDTFQNRKRRKEKKNGSL